MTVTNVVTRAADGGLDDFLENAAAFFVRELTESEITAEIGAGRGEIAPEARKTHRNGYRSRGWETRVGEIELLVARKRSGTAYFTRFWRLGGRRSRRSPRS